MKPSSPKVGHGGPGYDPTIMIKFESIFESFDILGSVVQKNLSLSLT